MAASHEVVERVEQIYVTAPETSTTDGLTAANLYVERGHRQVNLAAYINERTFDLKEVGAVPGLEREYLEEQQYISGAAANPKNGILDVVRVDNLVNIEKEQTAPTNLETEAFELSLVTGAYTEDSASTILGEDDSSDSSDLEDEEDLSTEIEKAVHESMVRSVRNTAVLSTQSKRLTIQSINRIRNSLFNAEALTDNDYSEAYNSE